MGNRKSEPKASFEGESTRSPLDIRYDLIPRESIDALGRRLALGAKNHGERNWETGGPEFRKATINHLFAHLLDYVRNGNTSDANTDAIICNAAFLCFFEARDPLKPTGAPHTPESDATGFVEGADIKLGLTD